MAQTDAPYYLRRTLTFQVSSDAQTTLDITSPLSWTFVPFFSVCSLALTLSTWSGTAAEYTSHSGYPGYHKFAGFKGITRFHWTGKSTGFQDSAASFSPLTVLLNHPYWSRYRHKPRCHYRHSAATFRKTGAVSIDRTFRFISRKRGCVELFSFP